MFNIGRLDGTWDLSRVDLIELTLSEKRAYELQMGDILFNRVNSRELVGKCAVVDCRTAGAVFESKNIRLRIDQGSADPEFIATTLNCFVGRGQVELASKQIVGQATINATDLLGFEVPLAPLQEQRRIVATLTEQMASVNQARQAADAELASINALPAALLRRAFSGEL